MHARMLMVIIAVYIPYKSLLLIILAATRNKFFVMQYYFIANFIIKIDLDSSCGLHCVDSNTLTSNEAS